MPLTVLICGRLGERRSPGARAALSPLARAIGQRTFVEIGYDATLGSAGHLRRTAYRYLEAADELGSAGYTATAQFLQTVACEALVRSRRISQGNAEQVRPSWLRLVRKTTEGS